MVNRSKSMSTIKYHPNHRKRIESHSITTMDKCDWVLNFWPPILLFSLLESSVKALLFYGVFFIGLMKELNVSNNDKSSVQTENKKPPFTGRPDLAAIQLKLDWFFLLKIEKEVQDDESAAAFRTKLPGTSGMCDDDVLVLKLSTAPLVESRCTKKSSASVVSKKKKKVHFSDLPARVVGISQFHPRSEDSELKENVSVVEICSHTSALQVGCCMKTKEASVGSRNGQMINLSSDSESLKSKKTEMGVHNRLYLSHTKSSVQKRRMC